MTQTINARPNLNGNTPSQFVGAGRNLAKTADLLSQALADIYTDVIHGRNYQHLDAAEAQEARNADLLKVGAAAEAAKEIGELATSIWLAGRDD